MVEQRPPTGRRAAGSARRTPAWALALLLLATGLLVPVQLLANSEDLAFSSSTSGIQRAGGRTAGGTNSNGGSTYVCRDAPVRYEVDGRRYETTIPVDGECLTSGDTRTVTVRYDPDEPDLITTNPRQTVFYAFIALAALGFLATLVAVVRRIRSARREGRETDPTGTLSP